MTYDPLAVPLLFEIADHSAVDMLVRIVFIDPKLETVDLI